MGLSFNSALGKSANTTVFVLQEAIFDKIGIMILALSNSIAILGEPVGDDDDEEVHAEWDIHNS